MNTARSADEAREIARRAYALWESEGRPHGRDQEHWARAEREFGPATAPVSKTAAASAEAQPTVAAPVPGTPTKKPAAGRKPAAETAPPAAKPATRRKATTGA